MVIYINMVYKTYSFVFFSEAGSVLNSISLFSSANVRPFHAVNMERLPFYMEKILFLRVNDKKRLAQYKQVGSK